MIAYLDTSVILRVLLRQEGALEEWRQVERGIASRLVEVECLRTLDRLRLRGELGEQNLVALRAWIFELMASLEVVAVSRVVLSRASQPFPTALGTLDAIHLATVLLWREELGESLQLATHDQSLASAARALGVATVGS